MLFGNKLDLNTGILTPHLMPQHTNSGSTYIADLLTVQDQVLDAAIISINHANDKHLLSNRA
jgi:hypothetical protein